MRVHEYLKLLGNRTKAAQWVPYARKEARRLRAREQVNHLMLRPRSDVEIRILLNGRDDLIRIKVAGLWGYVTDGWRDGQTYLRFSKDLATFPRRFSLYDFGVLSRDHILKSQGYTWTRRVKEGEDGVWRWHVGRRGRPRALFDVNPGGTNWTIDTYRQLYASLSEELFFSYGAQAYGTYWWGTNGIYGNLAPEEAPQFLHTLDGGESFAVTAMPRLALPDRADDGDDVYYWMCGAARRDRLFSVHQAANATTGGVGETRLAVLYSTDGGASWQEGQTLAHATGISGEGQTFVQTRLWEGLGVDWGVDADFVSLFNWSNIFAQTASFYPMAGKLLMVGFVTVTENPYAGYWRAFISADDGLTWAPRGLFSVAPQDAELRTLANTPGLFRHPVVLPDNRILSIQAGGLILMSDEHATSFPQIGTFPVPETARFGIPHPVLHDGAFKVAVTAYTGTAVVVYLNTDDTYTDWAIAGTIEELAELPDPAAPVLYPFTRVLGITDPLSPAFPEAYKEPD